MRNGIANKIEKIIRKCIILSNSVLQNISYDHFQLTKAKKIVPKFGTSKFIQTPKLPFRGWGVILAVAAASAALSACAPALVSIFFLKA
jgi:hypothetical protein